MPRGIETALEEYGLKATLQTRASLADVHRYIDQGRPPILLVRSGVKTWHYVVAIGYSRGEQKTILASPGQPGWEWKPANGTLDAAWTFSHDMDGHDCKGRKCRICGGKGKLINVKCLLCGGSGKIEAKLFGKVIGSTNCTCNGGRMTKKCNVCGGDGQETDFFRKGVEMFVSGHTLIVPAQPGPGKKPASPDRPGPGRLVLGGMWEGDFSNSLGEKGKSILELLDDEGGRLSGTWDKVALKGRRVNANTVELEGKNASRSYQMTGTLSGDTLTLRYLVTRLNASGSYEGKARLVRKSVTR
jgi:hypothetical protein